VPEACALLDPCVRGRADQTMHQRNCWPVNGQHIPSALADFLIAKLMNAPWRAEAVMGSKPQQRRKKQW
jgi:hypothetical protein